MKTAAARGEGLSENGINTRLTHKSFVDISTKAPSVNAKKIVRTVDKGNQLLAILGVDDYTAQTTVSVHPECVAFAFHLFGLSRKLFMYIIFYEVNNHHCRFTIDAAMMQRFSNFCLLFGEQFVGDKTILQGIRSLVRKNAMVLIKDNEYMLNPLIAGGTNENKRRKLIDSYSILLKKKGLDPVLDFYPRYLSPI
jgi:hypothetical protein